MRSAEVIGFDLWRCNRCKALFLFDFDAARMGDPQIIHACPICGEEESQFEDVPGYGLRLVRTVFGEARLVANAVRLDQRDYGEGDDGQIA